MKNRLMPFLIISLFLLSLFSFSIWAAAVPTPADALGNLGKFFTDLIGGKANGEQAYLLSFVLYFILFMAIFVEGLKKLPFFGGKGELSTPGKWFAAAAAGLATLGIFMGEQATGRTGKDFAEYITAPFGVWGGAVLAGLIALISYKAIKDSGVFGEEHLIPMAMATAIGVTIVGWLLSMGNMLGWGFLIMLLVFIVGLVHHLGKLRGERRESGEGAGKASEEDKKEERREIKQEWRALKKVYRFNKKLSKDLNEAHKEAEKIASGGSPDMFKIKEKIKEAKKYEEKEVNFDALVNQLANELKKKSKAEPSLKEKLDTLNKLLKVKISDLKYQIEEIEGYPELLTTPQHRALSQKISAMIRLSKEIEEEILGLEVVVKGLKRELSKK